MFLIFTQDIYHHPKNTHTWGDTLYFISLTVLYQRHIKQQLVIDCRRNDA